MKKQPNAPYSVVGLSFDRRELSDIACECARSNMERSEVIKQALKYWLRLDSATKDRAIMQDEDGEV